MSRCRRLNPALLALALAVALGPAPAWAAMPLALAKAYASDVKQPACVDHIAKSGELKSYTLATGQRLFTVRDSCGCGASNCRFGVYAPAGDSYRSVLLTIAQKIDLRTDGTFVSTSEGDAWESERKTYRWNGTTFDVSEDDVVYEGKTVKLSRIPVRFAAGASSTTLHGTQIANRFPDTYTFAASQGQTLTLTVSRSQKLGDVFLSRTDGSQYNIPIAHAGNTYTVRLPASASYDLEIHGTDDAGTFGSYTMQLAIR